MCSHCHTWLKSRLCVFISIHGHRHAHLFLSVLFTPSLYFFLKSFFHLFLNPAMVPDENSMEDPLCNSSFGSMVSLDYVTRDTDSQSNDAIKKIRNMVKTILSCLESRWGITVTRDHPVYPWMFEWAADLITRYAHVGDLGKTAAQLIHGSTKSSRNIAQSAETLWSPSRKHGGHVHGWDFSGHETAIR